MEEFDKLPEKAKEILNNDDINVIIKIFEFFASYAELITKSNVTKEDLEDIKAAIEIVSKFTDEMKEMIDTDIIDDLEEKEDSAQKQADISGDVDAGDSNRVDVFTLAVFIISFAVIVCMVCKKRKSYEVK